MVVDENWRAWHAGASFWRGHHRRQFRQVSVIELVNPAMSSATGPFRSHRRRTAAAAAEIVARHAIAPVNVVGHSDVAPTRKLDPGELFEWELLAKMGWPCRDLVKRWPIRLGRCRLVRRRRCLSHTGYAVDDVQADAAGLPAPFPARRR